MWIFNLFKRKEYVKTHKIYTAPHAYYYKIDSQTPTLIEYQRIQRDKWEKGVFEGNYSHLLTTNIIYLIQKSYPRIEIIHFISENINQ